YSQAGWSPTVGRRAMGDYVGNGGTWGSWSGFNTGSNSLDGPLVPSWSGSGKIVRITDITKGSSTTLLGSEKYLDTKIARVQPDCNDDQGWTDGWDNDTIAFAQGSGPGTTTTPQPDGNVGTCGLYFGGMHTGGVQVVCCDGSVRMVSWTVDPGAF